MQTRSTTSNQGIAPFRFLFAQRTADLMRILHCLACLIVFAAPAHAGPTTSFADLPGGVFVEMELGNPTGPFGPFDFHFEGQIVTATLVPENMSCPRNIGTHGEMLTIPNDPLVDPGDHNGRFIENTGACPDQTLTLDFSAPVRAAGVTFRHVSCGFTSQGNRTILVFDGPGGTGNMIGSASTQGFAYRCFNTWLDFVGVVSDQANIRSLVVLSDDDKTLMVGLAASPGDGTPPCEPDLDGSAGVDVQDLIILLSAWGTCPGKGECAADLNNSGTVDVQDLLVMLSAWGPCGS